jgi:hypothetical protein
MTKRKIFEFSSISHFQDIVKDNVDLSEFLIETLADKDDIIAVKYWSNIRLSIIYENLFLFSESIRSTLFYITNLGM